uniref:Condensin complex subunit 2 n=1 Tax=Globodera rostochiensis TaxID=31243 RepID=A0A914HET9_GLORO
MDSGPVQQVDEDYEANKRVAEGLKKYMGQRLNVMNAFETPILEGLMAAVKVEPLQCIGTVLDASAKCYAYRVDNTYGACYKVLSVAGGERVVPLQDNGSDEGQNEQEEGDTAGSSSGDEADEDVPSSTGERAAKGDKQNKNKLLRSSELFGKAKRLTLETRQLVDGLWKRFTTSANFGSNGNDLEALFNGLASDIVGKVMERRVGHNTTTDKPGSLDRKDNQFSIEDSIYRKVSKNFEEGSARSFVSNEVLMNDHGNFLVLHNHWQGNEPSKPFPSLLNHLVTSSAESQRVAIDRMNFMVERAQSDRPAEYFLLTQICADEEENVPTVEFQPQESFGQQDECVEGGGGDEEPLYNMDADQRNENPPVVDLENPLTTGTAAVDTIDLDIGIDEFEISEQKMIEEEEEATNDDVKHEGEAFGIQVAERENELAGDIGDEQIGRLIDENLLPPTQTDAEFVPLRNTQIEDVSHWKGDRNLVHDLTADQMRVKKSKVKRHNNESTKAPTKRRQPKFNDMDDANNVADDMCWIPKEVVSASVKRAIADIQQTSIARKRHELDDFDDGTQQQFTHRKLMRDKAKQLEAMSYDPINLLRARIFFKGHIGFWSYHPIERAVKKVRLIRRPHMLPPFSLPSLLKEQYDEFNKLYVELTDCQNMSDTVEVGLSVDEEESGYGAEGNGSFGGDMPADAEFGGTLCSATPNGKLRRRDSLGTDDDDELENGFGFLNNITLRDIKQIYHQTNFNVSKVKKAMMKVISSRVETTFTGDSSEDDIVMEEEEGDVSSSWVDESESSADDDDVVGDEGEGALTGKGSALNQNAGTNAYPRKEISSRELFARLPLFLRGMTKHNLTVTNSFAVLLHLCNDKQFILAQTGTDKLIDGQFTSEFFVKF